MIDWTQFPPSILPLLQRHNAMKSIRRQPIIYDDTYNFTSIDYGDIIHVDNRYFLVVGYTKEGRFGIDDQPKQWVPKVYDLESGERQILKLVFYETFNLKLGKLKVTCYRNPEKEGRVLELVQGDERFMQGYSTLDEGGNLVRVLDIIRGQRLDTTINNLGGNYDTYLSTHLEAILQNFLLAVEAIIFLHDQGLKHGDIRRDHILIDRISGTYRWIDFDYDFHLPERPYALDLIGLGNILLYILGRRNFRPVDVLQDPNLGEAVLATLHVKDLSILAQDRIFNLGKIYHQLPICFNDILLHFSSGTSVLYDRVEEFANDLSLAIRQVYG